MKKNYLISPTAVVSVRIKVWHIVLIALALTALVVGGILLGVHLLSNDGIDRDAVEYPWAPPAGSENADDISIPGYETITFPANEKSVEILLPNPSQNPCNFRFRMLLKDTGETLYQSGIIPPGMAVKRITLTRALAPGDYELEIQIETTSLSDATPMNGATMQVKLKVR